MLISPEFGTGGAERSIANLSVLLSEYYDVHFVVFNLSKEPVYSTGGQVHSLNVPAGKSFPDKLIGLARRIKRVRKLKRELRIDVSISFLEGADYVNYLSRQHDKIIVSIRGSKEADEDISGIMGWLRKSILLPWLFRRVDQIVCVSEGVKSEILRSVPLPLAKLSVIHNYYNVDAIQQHASESLPAALAACFDRPVLITSGRLHKQKNHKGLIRVAGIMKRKGVRFRLIILGEGSPLPELIQTCREFSLTLSILSNGKVEAADVMLLGYQANPWSIIKRSNVFVLSSSWEGFPNALAESMCLGLPIVSTDCPHGPRELLTSKGFIENGNDLPEWTGAGVLVPLLLGDAACTECAEVIQKIISDPGICKTMGDAGIDLVQRFTADRASHAWRNAIENPRL